MCRNHAHSPLGIVCHRLQNLWFRKKANYSRGATPEKMVAIFTAAASLSLFPSVSFCFFILSFLFPTSRLLHKSLDNPRPHKQVAERSNNLWLIPFDSNSAPEEWRKKEGKVRAISLSYPKALALCSLKVRTMPQCQRKAGQVIMRPWNCNTLPDIT